MAKKKRNIGEGERKEEKEEKKTLRKKIKEKEERQTRIFVIFMVGLILSVILFYFLFQDIKKFEYAGLEFEKIRQGNLNLYSTKFPLRDISGRVVAYLPFYFREDPRKLRDIRIEGRIILDNRKPVAITASKEVIESCEDSILAAATLSINFFGPLGIKAFPATTNKSESEILNRTYVSCNDTSNHSIILFEKGDENKIVKNGDCYLLEFKNCEIMNITERFILGLYAHPRNIEI